MRYYNASIRNLSYRLRKFEAILESCLEDTVRSLEATIVDYVAQKQLYEEGIEGRGIEIMSYAPYSPRTIKNKIRKGQPTNRVTLRDTGDFHRSFRVAFEPGGFRIEATDPKTAALIEKYGPTIFRLTDKNLTELLREYIRPILTERLKEQL